MTKKAQIIELLQNGTPPHQVAELVPCAITYVHAINRKIFGRRHFTKGKTSTAHPPTTATGRHCIRCTFIEELPFNPLDETAVCLYCRLQQQGVNLLHYHESGAWLQQTVQQGDTP